MATAQLLTQVALQNILVATDFSNVSESALNYAAAITRARGSKLFILHVIPREAPMPVPLDPLPQLDREVLDAEGHMQQIDLRLGLDNVPHEGIVVRGPMLDVVEQITQQKHIDLLVLGTHGRTGWKKLVLGSVAEELFRLSPYPVLTVGPAVKPNTTATAKIRRVLFATDFGSASLQALPYAIALASEDDGQLVLLHVIPPIPVVEPGPYWYIASDLAERQEKDRQAAIARLKTLVPEIPRCKLEFAVEFAFVGDGILRAAADRQADVIVMGVKSPKLAGARTSAHLPWATAHDVVCRAISPVLTVRE